MVDVKDARSIQRQNSNSFDDWRGRQKDEDVGKIASDESKKYAQFTRMKRGRIPIKRLLRSLRESRGTCKKVLELCVWGECCAHHKCMWGRCLPKE